MIDSPTLVPNARPRNEEYSTIIIPICLEGKHTASHTDTQDKAYESGAAHTRRLAAHPAPARRACSSAPELAKPARSQRSAVCA